MQATSQASHHQRRRCLRSNKRQHRATLGISKKDTNTDKEGKGRTLWSWISLEVTE